MISGNEAESLTYSHLQIDTQHNARNFKRPRIANNNKWEVFTEAIPSAQDVPPNQKFPSELFSLLKDTTDYAWYTTR